MREHSNLAPPFSWNRIPSKSKGCFKNVDLVMNIILCPEKTLFKCFVLLCWFATKLNSSYFASAQYIHRDYKRWKKVLLGRRNRKTWVLLRIAWDFMVMVHRLFIKGKHMQPLSYCTTLPSRFRPLPCSNLR